MTVESQTAPLLEWLLRKYPDTPKSRAKQWILAGRVQLHGTVVRQPHHRLADPGDSLVLGGHQAGTLDCGAGWQIHPRVSLLYLDSSLAIINKGPGLISVPAPNCDLSALSILADFLAGRLKAQDRGVAGKTLPPAYRKLQPLPVHRLDQYTSGVLCIATNAKARHYLIDQLQLRSMKREYVAYVEGRPSARQGTWQNILQLSRDELRQRIIVEGQSNPGEGETREAITHFEVLEEYPAADGKRFFSKLRFRLETGRKHQIRVQAAHAGIPLIGDRTYNPACRSGAPDDSTIPFSRQALHAEILELEHPTQIGRRMKWKAALPKDLRDLEKTLRAGRAL